MPASPSDSAPSGIVACLRTPCSKSAYGPPQPLGDGARDAPDLRREPLVHVQSDAGGARDELDRLVVVRRPEPAGDDAEVRLQPLGQRRLELVVVVADDRDARRLDAEVDELLREEGSVAVAAVAADELAARYDDVATRRRGDAARS